MQLTYEKLDPSLPDLAYAHDGDAGFDLHARLYADHFPLDGIDIGPNETRLIGTGIRMDIPKGYEIQIRPRSSLSRAGVFVQFGTVDSGYRGEIMVVITNNCNYRSYEVSYGDRIAQAVLAPIYRANLCRGDVDTNTDRGTDGFGSTGK